MGSAAARAAPATGEDSHQRILRTAIRLIGADGVAGMSLQRLADEVGLHKSTLFHHFRSKEEVCDSAMRLALDPLVELFPAPDESGPPELEQLLELSRVLLDHFADEPGTARFLLRCILDLKLGGGPEGVREPPEHPLVQIFARLGGWLERAQRAGAVRPLRVQQALLNLMGLVLLYPAITDGLGPELLGRDPRSEAVRQARREELTASLRGAFAPTSEASPQLTGKLPVEM